MTNLLKAGFTRIKKDKIFWGIIAITLTFALFLVMKQADAVKHTHELVPIETFLFGILLPIGLFMSVFISMFTGTEYSDGTLRNKIIAGHSREEIYLSNVILNTIVGVVILLVYMIAVKIFGITTFEHLQMDIYQFLFLLLDTLFIIISYSAIFTFISMMFTNKAASAIISILLVFFIMAMCAIVQNKLNEKEYIESTKVTNGVEKTIQSENPYYIKGTKRVICQLIIDLLPTGQSYQILDLTNLDGTKAQQLFIYSLVLTAFITGSGIYLFNKKNLN